MNFEKYCHYYRARLFETMRRPAKAIDEYVLALHHDPQFIKAAACAAYLYASQQQFDQAEHYYIEALRLAPGNGDMHFNLAYIYDRQGKREQAIKSFNAALQRKPKLDRAWYGMGMAYAALGRHDEAVKALEEAARLQPMNTYAWYALGMAYHRLHNPDKVKEIALHLHRIGPLTCRQLIHESERADLAYLVKDLVA